MSLSKKRPKRKMEMFVIKRKEGHGITLPSVTAGVFEETIPEHVDRRLVDFIKNNFKKVECARFIASDSTGSICKCGATEHSHSDEAREDEYSSIQPIPSLPGSLQTCTDDTDAFGEINFGGRNSSKYIRVSKFTEPSTILDLMYYHWKMERPNLLISVTGGAQNFTMKPRLKEVFRQGFIKAAQSTGAWIVTGGMNAGVMKHVGEAVRDYTLKHGSKNIITTIGVACWGCVQNRENLVSRTGCWPANYTSVASSNLSGRDCPLDPNHTHFILADDGTSGMYGMEIGLRSELERAISNSPTGSDRDSYEAVTVPVVCVVLEGGPNTIETVKNAISCGTPAIIVQGSGRAADILAHAYNNAIQEVIYAEDQLGKKHKQFISIMEDWLEKELREKIVNELNPKTPEALEKCLDNIRCCVNNRDFMTVFKLDGKDSACDIDITILKLLLKSNKGKRIDRLKLALAWNRADVAREQIFTDEAIFEPEDLYDLLYKAIIQNKVDFVKLLISKGVSLKEFVTVRRVLQLYNERLTEDRCKHLKKLAQVHSVDNGYVTLRHVGEFIKSLVGHYYEPTFCKSPYKDVNSRDYLDVKSGFEKSSKGSKQFMGSGSIFNLKSHLYLYDSHAAVKCPPPEFDDPANILFIWCVLVHLKEMSLVFWDIGKEDIAIALTAQHILKSLHEKEQDSEFAVELQSQTEFFGNLALGVLNECYMTDQTKATLLLVRQMGSFGDTTVLKMAVEADNKEFVAHPACQNLLTNIWTDRLSDDNSYFRILLALFLPICSPFLLRFRQKEIEQKSQTDVKRSRSMRKFLIRKKSKTPETRHKQNLENAHVLLKEYQHPERKEKNFFFRYWDQLEAFLKAPFTTFCYNSMSFFAFLLLYGVILLTDFYPITDKMPTIHIKEMVLIAWISTFLLEEFRQLLVTESSATKQKLLNYVSDPWNMADLVAILTFYLGLGLRFVPPSTCKMCFYTARIILAFNLMMFFLRVLHMFSVHQQLGPKLVMIKQMMVDLFYFVIIIMVFISSYGITSQVILFPNQPLNIHLAKDVLSDAWWSVYGEMNIDLVSGKECKMENDFLSQSSQQCFSSNATCTAEQCAVYGYELDDVHQCYGKEENCPANEWIVPILLAVYALITNVMMLNLLIAMFSNTFATIQGQTNIVWKMQRYHLIQEFESRPIWPPPLIIIGHLYQALRYLVIERCCVKEQSTKLGFRMKLNKMEEKDLMNWENIYAEEYLLRTESSDESTMEKQVKETFKKSDDIMFKLDQLAESNMLSHTTNFTSVVQPKLPPMLEERFSFIEEQLKRNSQALMLLMKHLKVQQALPEDITDVDEARKKDHLERQEEIRKKKESEMERFKVEMKLHKYSRCALYPQETEFEFEIDREQTSVIIRSPVPDNKVLFSVNYPTYKPQEYTSRAVILENYDEKTPVGIVFNTMDIMRKFSRKSYLGEYEVKEGYPINPKGRTGLRGRGMLRRWGPNPIYKVVLTRWCQDSSRSSKPSKYLSFLAVPGPCGSKKKAIPELLYHDGHAAWDCISDYVDKTYHSELQAWLSSDGSSGTELLPGYYDDPRNTDNAWLEYSGVSFHDDDGSVLTEKSLPHVDGNSISWERIHSNLDVYAADLSILKEVARGRQASF